MTAEIAIMNKEAIALAADSAVTMSGKAGEKIFTSANKLFTLSKSQPVGIMVYGNSVLMGVPWETTIKIYRNRLGKQKFKTLTEYAKDFIRFLDNGNPLFPDSAQEDYLRSSVYAYFTFVKEQITQKVHSEIDKKGEIPTSRIKQIVSETIREHHKKWAKTKNISSIPRSFNVKLINKYGSTIEKAAQEIFEKLPISKSRSKQLTKIAASLFSKFPEDIDIRNISGVVIAGFGTSDTFPSQEEFYIEGVCCNKLKYQKQRSSEIGVNANASITPFAQGEMVATFMEGIDPYLRNYLDGYLSGIFDKYPEIIADNIGKLNDSEKKLLKETLKEASNKVFKDYQADMQNRVRQDYIQPVLSVVAILPKDELAAMAESLVNLTAFKRKVTLESETVGGPIDVAVISKGDGFIWIKRKHYFKPELNPQFFAKYYEER